MGVSVATREDVGMAPPEVLSAEGSIKNPYNRSDYLHWMSLVFACVRCVPWFCLGASFFPLAESVWV